MRAARSRWSTAGVASVAAAACVTVSGPCEVVNARGEAMRVRCDEGGRVAVFGPGTSVATATASTDEARERRNNDWKARRTREGLTADPPPP
jgi:hypothetical protein